MQGAPQSAARCQIVEGERVDDVDLKADESGTGRRLLTREDYYLGGAEDGNARWCGRGAEALGLEGQVGEEEFRALCRGEDPAGTRIVKHKPFREKGVRIEAHRAGNDCTFSAPKSVSLAHAAGVEGIKEAHDAAVLSVLEHMEEHYCHYRTPGGILHLWCQVLKNQVW